jgi:hypothetical protein
MNNSRLYRSIILQGTFGGGLAFADDHHRALASSLLLVEMILSVLQLRDPIAPLKSLQSVSTQRGRSAVGGCSCKTQMGVSGFRKRAPTDRAFSVRLENRRNVTTGQALQKQLFICFPHGLSIVPLPFSFFLSK